MATKIEFTYNDKDYTLEYDAKSLKKLESDGFNFYDIGKHILNAPEEIFIGGFEKHHKRVPVSVRKEIWESISSDSDECEEELKEVLLGMINEALESIKPQGNLKWRKTT